MENKEMTRKALLYVSLKFKGDWAAMYKFIVKDKCPIPFKELDDVEKKIKCNYVTIFDEEYPRALKQLSNPPLVLYYYGDISLIQDFRKCISIIGSRSADDYGIIATLDLSRELSEKYVIVSGLAKGIDAFAHQGAIEMEGKTVAVLGSGIDICYPIENAELYGKIKENQLLISEYPNFTEPTPEKFPWRNRIIAALSVATVVAQANQRSGTSITVRWALGLGRAVGAIPHAYNDDSLCNTLIAEGAKLVRCQKDIEDEIRALGLGEIEL